MKKSPPEIVHEVPEEFVKFARKLGFEKPVICDIGSRDALEGIHLYRTLEANECHIFEPNPEAIKTCLGNINRLGDGCRILFNPVGLSDEDGIHDFFPVALDRSERKDIGFSSMLPINPAYSRRRGNIVQGKIAIRTTTLDAYFAKRERKPEILWIDVEGAELRVLRGASEVLKYVRLIHVEVSFRPMQIGKPLFWEVDAFLRRCGFHFLKFTGISALLAFLAVHRLLPNPPWRWNAIYYRPARETRSPHVLLTSGAKDP
jgi:2-O-methyltransferase